MSLLTFVPAGMVELMKVLSKSVIKDRPENIYEFAAEFFEKMLIERDGSLDKGYGKFRSYTEYCKFMDKMEQRRLKQPITKFNEVNSGHPNDGINLKDASINDVVTKSNIEIQGVAIQGVERKTKDYVKNVSMNPKYKSQSDIERETVIKPIVSGVKNVKPKPRKLSSKKPSENLIVIKEETSTDVDDVASNEDSNLHKAAVVIQKAVRKYLSRKGGKDENDSKVSRLSENAAALVIQKAFKLLLSKSKSSPSNVKTKNADAMVCEIVDQENAINNEKGINEHEHSSEPKELINVVHIHDAESKEAQLENKFNETVVKLEEECEPNQLLSDFVDDRSEAALKEIEHDETSNNTIPTLNDESKQTQPFDDAPVHGADVEIKLEQNQISKDTSDDYVTDDIMEFKPNQRKADASNENKDDEEPESKNKDNEKASNNVSQETHMTSNKNQVPVDQSNNIVTSSKMESDVEQNTLDEGAIQAKSEFIQNELIDFGTEDKVGQDKEFKLNKSENILENTTGAQELNELNQRIENAIDDITQKPQQQQQELKCDTEHLTYGNSESIIHGKDLELKLHELTAINANNATVGPNVESNGNLVTDELKNIPEDTADPPTLHHNKNDDLKRENDGSQLSPTTEQISETENFGNNLFTVKNEEIYVNLDLLKEKLGKDVINDTGSDSEKSFKLNIHEREEILVNQENVKHIEDDQPKIIPKETFAGANESVHCLDALNEDNYSETLNTPEDKTDSKTKDEGGNEEYELAETVVLDDIPVQQKTEAEMQVYVINPTIIDSPDSLKSNLDLKESNKSSKNAETQNIANIASDETQTDIFQPHNVKQIEADCLTESPRHVPSENIDELLEQKDKKCNVTPTTDTDSKTVDDLRGTSDEFSNVSDDLPLEANSNNEAIVKQNNAGTEIKNDSNYVATTVTESAETVADRASNFEKDASIISATAFDINEMTTSDTIPEDETKRIKTDSICNIIEDVEQYDKNTKSNVLENDNSNKEGNEAVPSVDQLLKSAENEKLAKAATVIQKVFRGYIVRKPKAIDSKNENTELKLSAALTIQKYIRGYLARRRLNKINNPRIINVTSNEKNEVQMDAETKCADSVPIADVAQHPKYSNRFLIPKDSFLERESFADDEDYASTCKELAATSIQKTYRGYRVRRSLRNSSEYDLCDESINTPAYSNEIKNDEYLSGDLPNESDGDHVKTVETEAKRVISAVLNVATDVLPLKTQEENVSEHLSLETSVPPGSKINNKSKQSDNVNELASNSVIDETHLPTASSREPDSILGQIVADDIHVEGQMQQKFNQMAFQDNTINPIEELSDSSEPLDTPKAKLVQSETKESVDSAFDAVKSFSYEQLSSDLSSDTDDIKRESLKESEIDETSRDERDDLSEVENFDLSSCGEDSLEAMYYSIRKSEIMLDKMQKHAAERRDSKNEVIVSTVEFPERVTETLDDAMKQVFKSIESSSDYDGGKKDEGEDSATLDIGLDDSSSINDDKEIETSRHIKRLEDSVDQDVGSDSTATHNIYTEAERDQENIENTECSESSDGNFNTSETGNSADQDHKTTAPMTRSMIKSQSVTDDMMNPIMFAMKRKQALLDQLHHVRPYPLQENLSEDHDAFPDHLLSEMDLGNIQRKIFASSVSETDSDYIEPTSNRRLIRDDFNISTALDHLSTDSDSTVSIVSAATKIQAGARGFLTRRRLQRTSVGDTSVSFEKRYSFGNAAIDKSLEDLIKRQETKRQDGAALKIQQQFRKYRDRKKNLKKVSPIREQTLELSGDSSGEGNDRENIGIRDIKVAQKKTYHGDDEDIITVSTYVGQDDNRQINANVNAVKTVLSVKTTPVNQRRQTLQRGDAVQRNSQPDSPEVNVKLKNRNGSCGDEKCKDSETGEYNGSMINRKDKKVTSNINIQSLINRGIGPRQRSMPVQIDSELMRIIPKHLRKRVKSADIIKKKNH